MSEDNESHFRKGTNLSHVSIMLQNMESLFENEQFCNVDLISMDGHKVRSHRAILAASSEYFRAMFSKGMLESRRRKVKLTNINGQCLRPLIRYCYTGVLEVTLDTAEELLAAAQMLLMPHCVDDCARFMAKNLTPYNCVGVMLYAEQHSCFELLEDAMKFALKRFLEVYKADEFVRLNLYRLNLLLLSNDLVVESEQDVFDAMYKWVAYDKRQRRGDFYYLLKNCVRMNLLPPTFLEDSVYPGLLMLGGLEHQRDTIKWRCMLLKHNQMIYDPVRIEERKWADSELLAVTTAHSQIIINRYSRVTEKWTPVARMTVKYEDFSSVMYGDQLVFTGGSKIRYDAVTSLAFAYNVQTGIFSEFYPMRAPRSTHGIAVVDGTMIAVGGFNSVALLDTAELFNANAKKWVYIPNMSTARVMPAVAALGGRMYVVGGHNGTTQLSSTECYDVANNSWHQCAPVHYARRDIALTACHDYLYLVSRESGGKFCTVERYDPEIDTWSIINTVSFPYYELRCTYLQGSLMVAASVIRVIERWDLADNASAVRLGPCYGGRICTLLSVPRLVADMNKVVFKTDNE